MPYLVQGAQMIGSALRSARCSRCCTLYMPAGCNAVGNGNPGKFKINLCLINDSPWGPPPGNSPLHVEASIFISTVYCVNPYYSALS